MLLMVLVELASAAASASVSTSVQFPSRAQRKPPVASSSQASQWARQQQSNQRRQVEQILAQLVALESREAESLDECANWFNLNVRYAELTGGKLLREGELRKRQQCDNMQRAMEERQKRLDQFRRQMMDLSSELQPLSSLIADYLELKFDPSIAEEFQALEESDRQLRAGTEQLEQLMQLLATDSQMALASSVKRRQDDDLDDDEADLSDDDDLEGQQVDQQADKEANELDELDQTLRRLVDQEANLSGGQLDQLAELGGMLEQILAEGNVDLNSGRFRYLSGTLDAVRLVLLHKLASDESTATATATATSAAQLDARAIGSSQSKAGTNQNKKQQAASRA